MKKNRPLIIGILTVVLLFLVGLIPFSYSKYETASSGSVQSEVAYYILDTSYIVNTINIPNIVPSVNPYIYSFSIANNDGTKRTETNLEYDLTIKTTTNLPLEYSLYLNEDYNNTNAQNIFISDIAEADINGTYFKYMKTDKRYFSFLQNEIDHYTLVVYFKLAYKEEKYQDIIESIELIINSKQVITE